MKVLHICETVKGGTATYLNELIPLLLARKDNLQIKLLMPEEHKGEVPDIDPAALLFFYRASRAQGIVFLFVSVIKALFLFRPDIVHAHSTFAGVAARLIGPLFGAKIIYCPHGWSTDREQPDFLRRAYAWVELLLSKLTTHFIAISDHERHRGIQLGIPEAKITRIYNGLKDSVSVVSPVSWEDERLKVLFVGRLDKDKGVDVLLEASRSLTSKIVLRIIGGAVIEEQKIRPDDYPYAQFWGWVSSQDIFSHMAACDVVVVPSRWEGFGYVAAEAMRLAKPVIASNVGGLKEVVKHGETGFLFQNENVAELEKLLSTITSRQIMKMGDLGRSRFLELFTARGMVKNIVGVYYSLHAL